MLIIFAIIPVIVILLSLRGATRRNNNRNARVVALATRAVEVELIRQRSPKEYQNLVNQRDTKRQLGIIVIFVFCIMTVIMVAISHA